MSSEADHTVYLDTFDAPVASAVVEVLRDRGIGAWTKATGSGLPGIAAGEQAVFVPAIRRDEAFAVLVGSMEEVRELADAEPRLVRPRGLGAPRSAIEDEEGPPIVMERIRRGGFLVALVLVPLLVITLARPGMPFVYGLVVFVGGMALLSAWRNREDDAG